MLIALTNKIKKIILNISCGILAATAIILIGRGGHNLKNGKTFWTGRPKTAKSQETANTVDQETCMSPQHLNSNNRINSGNDNLNNEDDLDTLKSINRVPNISGGIENNNNDSNAKPILMSDCATSPTVPTKHPVTMPEAKIDETIKKLKEVRHCINNNNNAIRMLKDAEKNLKNVRPKQKFATHINSSNKMNEKLSTQLINARLKTDGKNYLIVQNKELKEKEEELVNEGLEAVKQLEKKIKPKKRAKKTSRSKLSLNYTISTI